MNYKNLIQMFDDSVKKYSDGPCLGYKDKDTWETITWNETKNEIKNIANGLNKLGIHKGDRIAILSRTRYEWTLCDIGSMATGAVVVPIYETSTADQVTYILKDSSTKIVFIEDETQLQKLKDNYLDIPSLKQIICFFPINDVFFRHIDVINFNDFLNFGATNDEATYEKGHQDLEQDDIASIVYTSGTTGPPKGAILTHGNFLWQVDLINNSLPKVPLNSRTMIFLPLSHIFARLLQFLSVSLGPVQYYVSDVSLLTAYIGEIKPNFFSAVPRVFEKIHESVLQKVNESSWLKRKIFYWAIKVGRKRSMLEEQHKNVSLSQKFKDRIAYMMVFRNLHKRLGGHIKFIFCGGAPLSKEICEFFHSFGIHILEGYGMTEVAGAISVNSFENLRLGTIGKPIQGIDIKVDSDGELLVKGPIVFKGYHNDQDATHHAIDLNGWLHTGDLVNIDDDGFIKITDRKKDLIITAGGKNVAPQNIENLIKTSNFISECVVHGDKRKFLSALLVLNREQIEMYATKNQIAYTSYEKLIDDDKIHKLIDDEIQRFNSKLAKYETIKKFVILPHDFTIESGELTPTLKVKRRTIKQKYQDVIEDMYLTA